MQDFASRVQQRLAQRLAEGADGGRIADAAVTIWCDVDRSLTPIIGTRGTAALFKRSIYLVRVDLPWLASAAPEQASDDPYRGLREALSAQPGSIATAANAVLLQNFFNLLASLIGEPLSGRLLSAVLDTTASGDAQETET